MTRRACSRSPSAPSPLRQARRCPPPSSGEEEAALAVRELKRQPKRKVGVCGAPKVGTTTLDRVHQAMLLFASGRSKALKRFLVEEGVGNQRPLLATRAGVSPPLPSAVATRSAGSTVSLLARRAWASDDGPRGEPWTSQFFAIARDDRAAADELQEASLRARTRRWTTTLTGVVVRSLQTWASAGGEGRSAAVPCR